LEERKMKNFWYVFGLIDRYIIMTLNENVATIQTNWIFRLIP